MIDKFEVMLALDGGVGGDDEQPVTWFEKGMFIEFMNA